jgi:hypothetical protein
MKRLCQNCRHWTGDATSIIAICKLPRPGIEFCTTGRNAACSQFESVDQTISHGAVVVRETTQADNRQIGE